MKYEAELPDAGAVGGIVSARASRARSRRADRDYLAAIDAKLTRIKHLDRLHATVPE